MEKIIMENIKTITKKLFEVNYEIDFEDDNVYYEYLEIAEKLIQDFSWDSVYDVWYDYLLNNCKDEDSILNFANLFWCYEGYKQKIYNAVEFCAFLYANIDIKKRQEAGYLLEGMATEIFLHSGIYSQEQLFDYIPTNDSLVIDAINEWKKKGNGLH